jgi:hypothetical protein
MNRAQGVRVATLLLVAGLLFAELPGVPGTAAGAQAQGPHANAIVAFFKIFGAFRNRNRVYKEARVTQGEMDDYYGELLAQAQGQLRERELMETGSLSSEERSQLRVYLKLFAALKAEQAAVTRQIEAEKNQARRDFNRRVTNEVVGILVRSPGGQSLIGDLRSTVNELRQATQAVQAAIAANRPFDVLAQELSNKLTRIPRLQSTAYEIGQVAGHKLDQLLGGILTKIDTGLQNASTGMDEALAQINQIDAELARLDERERTPVSLVEEGSFLGTFHGVDRANAAADVAAQAFTNAAVAAGALRNPTPGEKNSMRERIRAQLLQNRLDRLAQAGQGMKHVVCGSVAEAEYLLAMTQLGRTPEKAADPSSAKYLVCRDRESGTLVHAALIGGAVAATATTTESVAEAEEPLVTEAISPGEDRCSLSGEGDFIIEQLQVSSTTSGCEDADYPFGLPVEPLLFYLAASGRWVPGPDGASGPTWTWQATRDLEGAVVDATARETGNALEIDVTMSVPPSGNSFAPSPSHGNGIALAALLPLVPLAWLLSPRRRRRWILLGIVSLSFLLMAQTCSVFGSFSGHYTFPLPEDGFACEVASDNPNLGEMPGSSGQASMQISVSDDEGAGESCTITATFGGLGVLKRDGFYTEDTFQ